MYAGAVSSPQCFRIGPFPLHALDSLPYGIQILLIGNAVPALLTGQDLHGGTAVRQLGVDHLWQEVLAFERILRQVFFQKDRKSRPQLLTGVVTRIDPNTGNASLRIGTGSETTEALLMSGEQVPGEELSEGMHVKVYVVDVRRSTRGPQILISRTHPGLVKRLFELEVPEIYDGIVEVRSIAREAGSRTKMAVWSNDENVDPIGACVGPRGQRVANIVEELRGEKIDIIKWSEDPAAFIAAALAPADVVDVWMADEGKACRCVVPDDQLSLAIGKEGQNARLAARLTGYKIDIKPASYQESEEASEPHAEETPEEF